MSETTILGVAIARLDRAEALRKIVELYEQQAPAHLAYANAHTLNLAVSDPGYKAALERADLILNDGSGVALAARLYGTRFPENLNGTDFNPLIVEAAAERGWPVYFLGGRPGVAERAAEVLRARHLSLQVAGTRDGFFTDASPIVAAIRESGAGLLLVAMGNPLQELFIDRHLDATGARLAVGVGAFFDFAAGIVPRSPAWMNRAGIEWVYRLAQEPRRMWKRYILGNPLFLMRVVKERLGRRS